MFLYTIASAQKKLSDNGSTARYISGRLSLAESQQYDLFNQFGKFKQQVGDLNSRKIRDLKKINFRPTRNKNN